MELDRHLRMRNRQLERELPALWLGVRQRIDPGRCSDSCCGRRLWYWRHDMAGSIPAVSWRSLKRCPVRYLNRTAMACTSARSVNVGEPPTEAQENGALVLATGA